MRAGRPYIVVPESQTTILPPTPRSGDRIGGSSGRRRKSKIKGQESNVKATDKDANNDANVLSNNVSNNFANNVWFRDGFRLRSRLRFRLRQSERRSSLHSSQYLGRYLLTNNGRYFHGLNHGFVARFGIRGTSRQYGVARLLVNVGCCRAGSVRVRFRRAMD